MKLGNFLNPKKIISQAGITYGTTVADLGFGKGEYLPLLSKEVGPEGTVYAFEIQEMLLKRVKNELKEFGYENINFLNTDLEKEGSTLMDDKSIDFILISNLFFQIENKKVVADEVMRILKNGGRVLFIDWKDYFKGLGPDKELLFKEDEALMFWEKYPVVFERRLDAGDYHYALIFRKK